MDKFQKKLHFDFGVNQKMIRLIAFIDSFQGKWNVLEQKDNIYLKELRKVATIESVGSSTRIEGAQLSDKEISALLNNLDITRLETRDQQEVLGYFEVLELIYENYSQIELSERYLLQLHQKLLKYSSKDDRHRGSYKNMSNKVVATFPDGSQKVIFNTTEPHLVGKEMSELIKWTNTQLTLKEIHPLVVSGLFIYEFLSIHPFQDGNGRLSRLLANFLILKLNYQFIQYISFENLIEQKKKAYYEALMDGQKDRGAGSERIESWILFFLDSIGTLIQRLEKKYDVFRSKGGYLNERQKRIKSFIEKEQPIKLGDLARSMPNVSINTLKKDLQYLKAEQIINSIGKNKGTVYLIRER
jgi:Fic family protein